MYCPYTREGRRRGATRIRRRSPGNTIRKGSEVGAVRCALFAACLVLPRSLLAQPEPLESRYQRGVALRAERRDADALAVFRAIYAETRAPRALAQVALAEAALGEWIDAETHLAEATCAVEDAWIRRNRAALG